jgi:4-hydroxy-3-methylbut-2-enyl diphosphate reductase
VKASREGADRLVERSRLLVCAPLRLEALALQPRLAPGTVRRTGYGRRSMTWAGDMAATGAVDGARALAVAGLGVGTAPALRPGDVVVATDVVDLTRPAAPPVLGASPEILVDILNRSGAAGGYRVRAGRVATTGRLVRAREARRLEADGVLAADLESAYLAALARGRPLAVVRVVVDTPAHPLARPDVVLRGTAALIRLAAVGAALATWAEAVRTPEPGPMDASKETQP